MKPVPRKKDAPAAKGRGKTVHAKNSGTANDPKLDSEAIERAVYDGMQDLRVPAQFPPSTKS
jgi:hypothetical protein